MTSDILRENNFNLIGEINAEVDEMPYRHLIKDKDFKKAVKHVVSSSCSVIVNTIVLVSLMR